MLREKVPATPTSCQAGRGSGRSRTGEVGPRHDYSMTVPVRAANGRIVGHVSGGTFRKVVRGSLHMLRRPPAWAFDVGSLTEAEAAGAIWVEVYDSETGRTYRAPLARIRQRGLCVNRGHGPQLALLLANWDRPGEPEAAGARQLVLFEEVAP